MAQGAPTLKRVHFELGGKNPVIVFDDADLDRALDAVVFMIYSLNGERCTSSSRLLVQESIAGQVHREARRARQGAQGRPSARSRDRSRPADPRAPSRTRSAPISTSPGQDGATIAVGGKPHDGPGGGHYVQPTLVTGAHADMRVAQEEVFGPFLTVIPFTRRGRGDRDRQRRALRPHRLCLDRRHGPRAARRRRAGGRHDLAEFRKRPPSADAVRRHEGTPASAATAATIRSTSTWKPSTSRSRAGTHKIQKLGV